jgi:hypothetical protein
MPDELTLLEDALANLTEAVVLAHARAGTPDEEIAVRLAECFEEDGDA